MSDKGTKRAQKEDKAPAKKETKKAKGTISQEVFLKNAKPLSLSIGNSEKLEVVPKVFNTGSFGWGVSGRVKLPVGDEEVEVQVTLNLPVSGSKPKKEKEKEKTEEAEDESEEEEKPKPKAKTTPKKK
eukprot:TRINITY_DN21734_c0_g1_i1.p2 TRINITY_DN21734_c0_g1~~TRINITY_DN21734_c0_g1_i1.p2  ORF type:complete len:128 (+),score=21.25 TRINITY_DN21734_c0_g1_i1:16-399(+)